MLVFPETSVGSIASAPPTGNNRGEVREKEKEKVVTEEETCGVPNIGKEERQVCSVWVGNYWRVSCPFHSGRQMPQRATMETRQTTPGRRMMSSIGIFE
jgi:hypothetical protein